MTQQEQGTKISAAPQIIWGALSFFVGAVTAWMAWVAFQAYREADNRLIPFLVISIIAAFVAGVFGLASFLCASDRKKRQGIVNRRSLFPDNPWLWSDSDEWRSGRITALPGGVATAVYATFAAIWNGVVIGFGVAVFHKANVPTGAYIALAVFTALGLFLIGQAIYLAVSTKKFERGIFQMRHVPGTIAGSLEGLLQLPRQLPAGVEVRVELVCEKTSGTGKNSTNTCLFQRGIHLHTTGGDLPVSFQIPPDVPPSDNPDHRGITTTQWLLKTKAIVPGVDYSDVFIIPVFSISEYHSVAEGMIDASESVSPPAKTTCKITESGGAKMVVTLQGVRYWGCGIVTAFLFPVFALFAGFLFEGGFRLGIHIAGLFLGLATLSLLCMSFLIVPTRIEIDRDSVRIHHGKTLFHRTRTVPLKDVAFFKFVSSGDPPAQHIDVFTRDGKNYRVAEDLSGSEETKWLTIELTRALRQYLG